MSESDCDKQMMKLKVSTDSAPIDTCKDEAMQTACHEDNYEGRYGSISDQVMDCPWDPSNMFIVLEKFDWKKVQELTELRNAQMAKAKPNDIITPDPTSMIVKKAFYDISDSLGVVLEKDSVRCFLRLFTKSGTAMSWNMSITSETLTYMIQHNALRCAKVVLEGKAPELCFMHANPNCINPHGYFPLHEAAERFSVDMVKLLFRHGASANVRALGDSVIEGLLPLHVAVENACMHKYLEDNLSPTQYHRDNIYKLIHLLCLPEMKIFLDTITLLAERTDNLVDELWNYIKGKKLVQSSVLLLAAQKQIRKHDGFNLIMYRIYNVLASLVFDCDVDNGKAWKEMEGMYELTSIFSQAGEALEKYIQAHSEVPHVEVLERVSSILKEFGFCPKEHCVDIKNLRPYNCQISVRELHGKGHVDATKELLERSYLCAAKEKAVRKKILKGWDPAYTRRSFFPYWRSVLGAHGHVKVYPAYAAADDKPVTDLAQLHNKLSNESSNSNQCLGVAGRIQQLATTGQSKNVQYCCNQNIREAAKACIERCLVAHHAISPSYFYKLCHDVYPG